MSWSFREYMYKIGTGVNPNPPCSTGLDVAFLIDYTASMSGVINTVKNSVVDIIEAISNESGNGNYRLGLVISDEYDNGGEPTYNESEAYTNLLESQKNVNIDTGHIQYNTAMELFSINNETSFTTQLNVLNTTSFPLGSGGGEPEPLDIALDLVVNNDFLNSFRVNTAKYILIFTDARPGGSDDRYNETDDLKIAQLTTDCISKGIKVFVIGAGARLTVWQDLSTNTGGTFSENFNSDSIISQIVASCQELDLPVANAGGDRSIKAPTTMLTLDGTGSFDPDGNIATYLWEVISGPTGYSISNPNIASPTIRDLQEGSYQIKLTVTDNDGLQDVDFLTLVAQGPNLNCGDSQNYNSPDGAGVYSTTVELGSDLGVVFIDYDSGNIPDRFQAYYDGVLVADSLLVGDFLTGNPPNANTTLWLPGTSSEQFVGKRYDNIPDYEWNGFRYVATGVTNNFRVDQSDVAPSGQTAGAGRISFNKNSSTVNTVTIVVTSFPDNTGWNFMVSCPTQL